MTLGAEEEQRCLSMNMCAVCICLKAGGTDYMQPVFSHAPYMLCNGVRRCSAASTASTCTFCYSVSVTAWFTMKGRHLHHSCSHLGLSGCSCARGPLAPSAAWSPLALVLQALGCHVLTFLLFPQPGLRGLGGLSACWADGVRDSMTGICNC